MLLLLLLASRAVAAAAALNVVLAGGTGPIGRGVAGELSRRGHDVTVLTRNAFLASSPARVTEQFGWLGRRFLEENPGVTLRDWDGGDLLDIVGKDWLGWQDDVLPDADAVVHLVGGFTDQRVAACERLVRECVAAAKTRTSSGADDAILHVTVNPLDDELPAFSPGMADLKRRRIETCEDIVKTNCANWDCLRIEAFRPQQGIDRIVAALEDRLSCDTAAE